MKKVPTFYGNRPPSGQRARPWEEYLSEFTQNAEVCSLPLSQYQKMADLLLSPKVREQCMQAKANMDCDNWEGMNQYMRTHFSVLDKSMEAQRKYMSNKVAHGTKRVWQQCCSSQARYISEMGALKKINTSEEGLWGALMQGIPKTMGIHSYA